jgi:hypothetical protein
MAVPTPIELEAMKKAGERLHHVSMRYVGALCELVHGKELGGLPSSYPGLRTCRDFIDLILLCRAEINALTACLTKAGVLDHAKFIAQCAEEYDWLTARKAEQFGFKVTDVGLEYTIGGDG